ncbi:MULTISPECIES: hypothetical protein [Sphingomonas]|uniref:hypothetical protein n=1 Tax=Sphingomonas TaxID=13687 RepID=UPI001924FFFE|nr:hypothetical protein [Sphingomonas sp. CCH10-B3]
MIAIIIASKLHSQRAIMFVTFPVCFASPRFLPTTSANSTVRMDRSGVSARQSDSISDRASGRAPARQRKGPPGCPDGPSRIHAPLIGKPTSKEAYFFSVAIASFDAIASFEAIASFDDIIASFEAIAPSVAVMLSVAIASVSLFIDSVAIASLVVVVSVFAQAEISSAALATIEPVTTLAMSARI